jgi:hypothetical protein
MSSIENFKTDLEQHLSQFKIFLQPKLKPRTIHQHCVVISYLIDFLCFGCGATGFQDIRRSMVCSRFRKWYCSNMADLTESQVNTSVKKFFSFLVFEQKISVDKEILVGLKIKIN